MRLPSNRFAQDSRAPYPSQCRDAGGDAVLGELTAVVLSRRTHVEGCGASPAESDRSFGCRELNCCEPHASQSARRRSGSILRSFAASLALVTTHNLVPAAWNVANSFSSRS